MAYDINGAISQLIGPPPPKFTEAHPFSQYFNPRRARRNAQKEFRPYYQEQQGTLKKDFGTTKQRTNKDLRMGLADIGVRRGYAGTDLATGLADIGVRRGYAGTDLATALADVATGRTRTTENRAVARTNEDQSFNPMYQNTLQQSALAGHTFGGLGSSAVNQLQTARSGRIGAIQSEYSRGMQDLATQEKAANEGYGRSIYGLGQEEAGANQTYGRSIYGLGQEQKTAQIGANRTLQDALLGFNRGRKSLKREYKTSVRKGVESRRGLRRQEYGQQLQRYYDTWNNGTYENF